MERVEGLLQNLKLSEKERKSIKIGWAGSGKAGMVEPQALAKLLSEKPVLVEAMAETLGRIWCPIRGLDCKEVGENKFLFTFGQESGKRMAVEGGPWEFGNDLLVFEDFVPRKRLEDYAFDTIPIWVRVLRLPLGLMCREAGEKIGEEIGEVLEVDARADGKAVGKFLRIKVRMNIKVPLMRGFILDEGKEEEGTLMVTSQEQEEEVEDKNWCPFEYEYLPDFCYVCGIIGHIDTACGVKLKKGEKKQFGPWLRAFMPRRGGAVARGKWGDSRSMTGSRGTSSRGMGAWKGRTVSGSDAPSWRKESKSWADIVEEEERGQEVTSPLKKGAAADHAGTPKRLTFPGEKGKGMPKQTHAMQEIGGQAGSDPLGTATEAMQRKPTANVHGEPVGAGGKTTSVDLLKKGTAGPSTQHEGRQDSGMDMGDRVDTKTGAMQRAAMLIDVRAHEKEKVQGEKQNRAGGRYKKIKGREGTTMAKSGDGQNMVQEGSRRKREATEMELDGEDDVKKQKKCVEGEEKEKEEQKEDMNKKQCMGKEGGQAVDSTSMSAGLLGQPCESQ